MKAAFDHNTQQDYEVRINKVFEYIDRNLVADLSLEKLADIAHFSPYHFHRIFKTITGETVNEFVTRQRIERAAAGLVYQRDVSVTELSLKCGFSSNSSFTRAFKKFYGVSPSAFRSQHPNKFSKIGQVDSKIGQASADLEKYICIINQLKDWTMKNAKIEIKEMPKLNLAYVPSIGPQNLEGAFTKLMKWAAPKGLMENADGKMMTIYRDTFKVTDYDKVKLNACMILDRPQEAEGQIGMTSMDAGKCVVGRYEIGLNEFDEAWTGLFVWMNENGYQKADINPFEIYQNDFQQHPENKFIVDMYIPVK